MDFRNVIFAIALSFAVLFGWSVIFETPQIEEQKKSQQTESYQKKESQSSDSPSVNLENNKVPNISREDAIVSGKRIKFENENVKGSIALKGALIDDIIFKNYKSKLDSDERVTYLNPVETNDGYFVETGWASSNIGKISLPTAKTVWKVKGNNKLSIGNPVIIEWDNKSAKVLHSSSWITASEWKQMNDSKVDYITLFNGGI